MTLVTRHIIGRAQSVPRKAVPDVAPPNPNFFRGKDFAREVSAAHSMRARLKIGRYSLVRNMCIAGLDALSDGERPLSPPMQE